jgi:Spirocyclase AveC-like
VTFLYYFRNDKGQTWAERGIDQVRGGPAKQNALRVLAMIGVFQVGIFILYTVPQTSFFASKSAQWPRDIQERSYLTDGMCGAGTTSACPGPQIPLNRGNGRDQESLRVTPDGRLFIPKGTELPRTVPFASQPKGAFSGPLVK